MEQSHALKHLRRVVVEQRRFLEIFRFKETASRGGVGEFEEFFRLRLRHWYCESLSHF